MPWLPQINEDCAKLSAHAETPGDGVLVDIVRICRSSQQVFEISRHVTERPIDAEHIAMHVGPLLASFEQLKSTLSEPQLKNSKSISCAVHGRALIEICRYSGCIPARQRVVDIRTGSYPTVRTQLQ